MFQQNTTELRRFTARVAPILYAFSICSAIPSAAAAEHPFFIAYTHQMEEPGNLEIAFKSVLGNPGDGHRILGGAAELEYGVKAWWTTEIYLDSQHRFGDTSAFTGYRWENRFRLLPREHWINPVLYVEFENINGADRALLEVVGTDGKSDLTGANAENRVEKKRELEAKLILGSHLRGWTIAENFIVEKNVRHAPYEFGYAAGVSRPLGLAARPDNCSFCPENIQVGVEMYGGLGTHEHFGLRETSHYIAPTVSWNLPSGGTFRISPGFGVTDTSVGFLLRVGMSYEFQQLGKIARRQLGRNRAVR